MGQAYLTQKITKVEGTKRGYVRPQGAPNMDTIVASAPDIEQEGIVYQPIFGIAAKDTFATVSMQKSVTHRATCGDAFVFSDEPNTLYIGDTTHTFDRTKDFATSEPWKARYILIYATAANKAVATGLAINISAYRATYEFVAAPGLIIASTAQMLGQGVAGGGNKNVAYINLENATFYQNKITSGYFNCTLDGLKTIKLPPSLTEITGSMALAYNYSLEETNLENIVTVSGANILGYAYSLKEVNLSSLKNINSGASNFMQLGSSLERVDLPLITTFSSSISAFDCVQFIGLPEDFNIGGVNFTGKTGYPKSLSWLNEELPTKLKDNSGGTAKTMTLGATNIALIEATAAAIISAKNWTIN